MSCQRARPHWHQRVGAMVYENGAASESVCVCVCVNAHLALFIPALSFSPSIEMMNEASNFIELLPNISLALKNLLTSWAPISLFDSLSDAFIIELEWSSKSLPRTHTLTGTFLVALLRSVPYLYTIWVYFFKLLPLLLLTLNSFRLFLGPIYFYFSSYWNSTQTEPKVCSFVCRI